MATAERVCRVCGKPYEACHTLQRTPGTFRWQEVACSPTCGEIYLEQIAISRGVVASAKKQKNKKPSSHTVVQEDAITESHDEEVSNASVTTLTESADDQSVVSD